MAQCATTALAGAVPGPCVRGACGLFVGVGAGAGCCVFPVSPFPPRVSHAACGAIPSGGPLPSLAGTPSHAVCAFRELGPVALLVVPACPLRVCALALPWRPFPPPWVVWRAHLARSQHWALVGPFHVVRAPPRVLLRSLAPSGMLGRGRSGPGSPVPGLGLCAPRWAGLWRSCARGRVLGGGAAPAPCPPFVRPGGPVAGGLLCLVLSLCLPWAGSKAGVTGVVLVMGGVVPISLRFVLARLLWARSVRHPGTLARDPLLPAVPVGAGDWGGGAGRALAPLSGGGGGGTIPPASGGGVRRPRGLHAGGGGGGGGVCVAASLLPLWGAARGSLPWPPSCRRRTPPRRARSVGVAGPPLGGGGMRGGPWTPPPGAPSDLNPPSALPKWAMVMGGSWRARPPYCSGAPPCAAPRLGPRAAPASWCGLGAAGWGRWGARCAGPATSPPPASRSLLGEGGRPLGSGGTEGRPCGPQAGGGSGGGGWGGRSAAPRHPAPSGIGLPSVVSGAPPRGILPPWGLPGGRVSGAALSAAIGSVPRGGEGRGGHPPALVRVPAFPRPASEGAAPFAPSWAPPVRRWSAAGRAGVCGRFTGGARRGRGACSPRV